MRRVAASAAAYAIDAVATFTAACAIAAVIVVAFVVDALRARD